MQVHYPATLDPEFLAKILCDVFQVIFGDLSLHLHECNRAFDIAYWLAKGTDSTRFPNAYRINSAIR